MLLEELVAQLNRALDELDCESMVGDEASRILDGLSPLSRKLNGTVAALCAHGVRINQHLADSYSSGATWVASKTGSSERQARAVLALQRELAVSPRLKTAVRNGAVSLETATLITRNNGGNENATNDLLDVALDSTFEKLHHHIRENNELQSTTESKSRLRRSQFVSVGVDTDSMIVGSFRLRPALGTPLLQLIKSSLGDTSWERAETFALRLGAALDGSSKSSSRRQVVFHLDLESPKPGVLSAGNHALLRGVGKVHPDEVLEHLETASRTLIGNVNNKLVWFSEQDGRTKHADLPDFIKRAIKANSWDMCQTPGCDRGADHVDHIVARCNGGVDALDNLQSLCNQDHHLKTRNDAPWTRDGIYDRKSGPEPYTDTG